VVQVLVNLIENALDLNAENGQIRIRLRAIDGATAIEVIDSGPGIPVEARGRIYDQFFTTKARGLGLGLAIARHIAEEHGGKIEFETFTEEEGKAQGRGPGTTFRIILPAKRDNGT
jgi:signal transduction histidine kinase